MSETGVSGAGKEIGRRRLLRAGVGLGVVAVGSVVAGVGPAYADLDASNRFKLGGDGDRQIDQVTLHQPTWAMQSFAYDNLNGHIYFAQHRVGDSAGHNGDLWISKTDLTGNILGVMALHGFGHGSSMAVEPSGAGTDPFLWLEADDSDDNGSGQRLARFQFVDQLTLEYTNPSIPIDDRTPTIDDFVKLPRPAIDPYAGRLLVRYAADPAKWQGRTWRIVAFEMADAAAGRLDQTHRKAERAIPNNDELGLTDADLFQGITLCGQYAYLSYGGPGGPSYLVTLDMNGAGDQVSEVFHTTAGASLEGREPQGTAIWLESGQPRLAFGFSAKHSGNPPTFDATIFYKSQFLA